MQTNVKQVVAANNSNSNDRKADTLKNLQKAKFGNGGTVTYHFVTEREKFKKNSYIGEKFQTKSVLKQPIQDIVLYKRGIMEIYSLLESISNDLGASYFTVE